METIVKAAIKYSNGIDHIYTGWRHCYIGITMVETGACPRPYPGGDAQGFITNVGRFVGRVEALAIAKAAGQTILKHGNPDVLYSEDLWNVDGSPFTEAQIAAMAAKYPHYD